MTDIVERLRRKVFRGPTMEASHTKTVEWQAADEIERLRAALEQIVAMDEVALIEWKKGDGWLHQRVARAALEGK